MLYLLAVEFRDSLGWLNLFTYVTSRAVFSALSALLIGLITYPYFIRWQKGVAIGEQIRNHGPDSHRVKQGTPTMGGVIILIALLFGTLLWGDLTNPLLLILQLSLILFGCIGFADDWLKLRRKSGLTARLKLFLQIVATLLILVLLWSYEPLRANSGILIPYWKDLVLPFGLLGFFIVGSFCIVGASNAVNLTDGLDGLAIMPAVMVSAGLGVLAYVAGHGVFSEYLELPNIMGAEELVIFCSGLCGAGLAFLWYNAAPAQVFMGDTGSLAIGASLATVAVAIRQEFVFAIMGGLFVLEVISVIAQVLFFKISGGRRIFRMAPLHHHYEEKGWPENVVVVRFWIITIFLVLCGLSSLKIR